MTIPPKVVIAEAIRLTRKFGTPMAANFVNAFLDQVLKKQEGKKVSVVAIKEQMCLLEEQQVVESFKSREVDTT